MAHRTIDLSGDQIQVRADVGPGRVVHAVVTIEDGVQDPRLEPPFNGEPPRDQWEKDFQELCALAPINHYPVDDSREAIYGDDPGESESA